ncbi:ribosomal-protein-alanine acetyltransferase, putative [Oceanicola granulosus HTCC2516]|uniref:Ribosomal-protein-alanine acetyltransferase, putative n=1 Tax=Oceanicola granulosus (strain ATCC BAA-861 / DSM 15982 / KCTC 12143 / HTCC2516) TaxID=314256 RepID=Q2CI59_OCEGH|nr:GNAT family N-acetyltransferase [Oceanicola granulosus]EAR52399.1 ribosomal-protein-alanine acetyltransferase, putative [Oceanicola granulosus HTCC2516]
MTPGSADVAAWLAELHARAYGDRPWSAEEFADLLASPGALLVTRPAAFLLARRSFDEAEILTLATDPAVRRSGNARACLDEFHERARTDGAVDAFLEVAEDNAPARALYAAAGYTEAGRRRRYYPRPGAPAADALVLSRTL